MTLLPTPLHGLSIPLIAAPMFLISNPELVIATCGRGVVGTFPALNARTSDQLADWIDAVQAALAGQAGAAPFGVNLTLHRDNGRFPEDVEICAAKKVPLIITSMSSARSVVERVHAYGGLVFHDVTNLHHARKAAEAGVDGIIAIAAGAGGHGGTISPFALVKEIRSVFSGTIVLGGGLTTGGDIAAAIAMGADMAYMGTLFIATHESTASADYKAMLGASSAADVIYTPAVSGVPANFLRASLEAGGYDLDAGTRGTAKPWREVWSAGHGVGQVGAAVSAASLCDRLVDEYRASLAALVPLQTSENRI